MTTWFDRYRSESQGRIRGGTGSLPAELACANAEPYDFTAVDDETLFIEVDDAQAVTVTFPDAVFANPAAATAAEVVARINSMLATATASTTFGGEVALETRSTGSEASIRVTGGGANVILGFQTDVVYGDDSGHVFVLGAVGHDEVASLTPGDYTEIMQKVDLTGVDVVEATIDTVGAIIEDALDPNHRLVEADTLFCFPMDRDYQGATNAKLDGFDLNGVGAIVPVDETYSAPGWRGKCREIPAGSTAAGLVGVNDPQWMQPGPLAAYTLEFWLDFESDEHPSSWGISPVIFQCGDLVNGGMMVRLSGAAGPGAHQWIFNVTHWDGIGGATSTSFPVPVIDASPGWLDIGIVFDVTLGPNSLTLYVDGVPVGVSFAAMGMLPAQPPVGQVFTIGSAGLWGRLDQMRMSNTAHTPLKVLEDHLRCVQVPTSHSFSWKMQILVDGVVYVERVIPTTEVREWYDFRAPVRSLAGDHEVAFRLLLEEN